MKESRKEFIFEAHRAACENWKTKIEKEFPKLFEKLPILGKWYTDGEPDGMLVMVEEVRDAGYYGYGFNGAGVWRDNDGMRWGSYDGDIERSATDEEVKQRLMDEAYTRGFIEGVKFKLIKGSLAGDLNATGIVSGFYYEYREVKNELMIHSNNNSYTIFSHGEWAVPLQVKEYTIEQIERELNCVVQIVK